MDGCKVAVIIPTLNEERFKRDPVFRMLFKISLDI